ncbi:MAG: ATP-binding protein [Melioribacteraceae bacterium]|nr:ATP-binding protein [Melioribacteraceae bacterium]
MVITVASGKGGTGKTTVAASMADVLNDCVYMDGDVEEPNGHILLNPEIKLTEKVFKTLPSIDFGKCDFCGKCIEVCEFNALINLKSEIILFEEMCHSCGACIYFCPQKAISEVPKEIGVLRYGTAKDNITFFDGILRIGEPSAVPLLKRLKSKIENGKITIIDSPPGTSCSMVEAVKDSDYCVLVTESTPFGLNDLKLAVDVLKIIGIPFGIIINKYQPEFRQLEEYITANGFDLLLKIPFEREIAEAYSKGILPVTYKPELRNHFKKLMTEISGKIKPEKVNAG